MFGLLIIMILSNSCQYLPSSIPGMEYYDSKSLPMGENWLFGLSPSSVGIKNNKFIVASNIINIPKYAQIFKNPTVSII